VMSAKGMAIMGTGRARGENRAVEAATAAISSPLLENISIDGATGIILNVTGGLELSLSEVNEASTLITEAAHEDAEIIFGAVIDESMGDEVRVTVIATGFGMDPATQNAQAQFQHMQALAHQVRSNQQFQHIQGQQFQGQFQSQVPHGNVNSGLPNGVEFYSSSYSGMPSQHPEQAYQAPVPQTAAPLRYPTAPPAIHQTSQNLSASQLPQQPYSSQFIEEAIPAVPLNEQIYLQQVAQQAPVYPQQHQVQPQYSAQYLAQPPVQSQTYQKIEQPYEPTPVYPTDAQLQRAFNEAALGLNGSVQAPVLTQAEAEEHLLQNGEKPLPRDILLAKVRQYRENQVQRQRQPQPEQLSMDVGANDNPLETARRLASEIVKSPFDSRNLDVPAFLRRKQQVPQNQRPDDENDIPLS